MQRHFEYASNSATRDWTNPISKNTHSRYCHTTRVNHHTSPRLFPFVLHSSSHASIKTPPRPPNKKTVCAHCTRTAHLFEHCVALHNNKKLDPLIQPAKISNRRFWGAQPQATTRPLHFAFSTPSPKTNNTRTYLHHFYPKDPLFLPFFICLFFCLCAGLFFPPPAAATTL